MQSFISNKNAVSQVVSTLLVLSIVMGSIGGIMYWGIPYIEERKMESQRESLFSNFELIDNKIGNLIISGPDSISSGVIVSTNKGSLIINSTTDKLIVMYAFDKGYNFTVEGFEDNDNKFKVLMKEGDASAPAEWYDDNPADSYIWAYRQEMTVAKNKVPEIFTNMPVILNTYVDPYQNDAGDIIFINKSGNVLNHEIEYYNDISNKFIAWVNLSYLPKDNDTVFYMYYNNSNPGLGNLENPTGVWDSDFVLVQHLNEETGNLQDSTVNNLDLVVTGADYNISQRSFTDGGYDVDGVSDYLFNSNMGANGFDGKSSITIECMVNVENLSDDGYILELPDDSTSGVNGPGFNFVAPNKIQYHMVTDSGSSLNDITYSSVVQRTWYHLTLSYASNTFKGFLNGEEVGSIPVTLGAGIKHGSNELNIGRFGSWGEYSNGSFNEIRISNIKRSDNWIKTSYDAMQYGFVNLGMARRYDGAFILDNVDIYKLDPALRTDQYTPESNFRKIYEDNWCAQSFVSEFTDDLWWVSLNIGKMGYITDDLTVSIYNDAGGVPSNLVEPTATDTILANEISPEMNWIDCYFDNPVGLTQGNMYHIVLNTTEDNTSISKFYKWQIEAPSIYDDGSALYSTNKDTDFQEIGTGEYDFKKRLFYATQDTPKTPEISTFFIGGNQWYTGVTKDVCILKNTSDPISAPLQFQVDWGDGNNTGWPFSYTVSLQTSHIWKKPGIYTMLARCRTFEGIENQNDNDTYSNLYISDGIAFPSDIIKTDKSADIDGETITSSFENLNGTLLINLYSKNYPYSVNFNGLVPFGRIWVFDLGSIKYTSPYITGEQSVIYQNGAVLYSTDESGNVKNEPAFVEKDDTIALRVIQINQGARSGGGGIRTYKLKMLMQNSLNRERPASFTKNVSGLRLQFYGDNTEYWRNYFLNNFNFSLDAGSTYPDTIRYNENEKMFLLDSSLVKFDVEV